MSEEQRQDQQEQREQRPNRVQGLPDRDSDLAADAFVYDNPPADSELYEIVPRDPEDLPEGDSPVGGMSEQVLKDQD